MNPFTAVCEGKVVHQLQHDHGRRHKPADNIKNCIRRVSFTKAKSKEFENGVILLSLSPGYSEAPPTSKMEAPL
eukprot:scaffold1895_cov59-Cyclotella_meneghiniana.AAC.4